MTGTMYVVYVQATGTVLAAVTMAAPPAATPTAQSLVGDSFALRDLPGVSAATAGPVAGPIRIPKANLAVVVIDPNDKIFADPLGYSVTSDVTPTGTNELKKLSQSWHPPEVKIDFTIENAPPGNVEAYVWVQSGTGEPDHLHVSIPNPDGSTLTGTITGDLTGPGDAVVIVPGYRPAGITIRLV